MTKLSAAVVVFPGSNGDMELMEALAGAGFTTCRISADAPLPEEVALVALPGGFSYGDYWRAGMLARQAPAVRALPQVLRRGGLVLGICNGFQILVEAGLLPGALMGNQPPGFVHRWVEVEVQPAAQRSPFFAGLVPGSSLRLPIAHGEGLYFHAGGAEAALPRAPLTYRVPCNGSQGAIAAMHNETGQVLGMMPHPERAVAQCLGGSDGARLFASAHAHLRDQARL